MAQFAQSCNKKHLAPRLRGANRLPLVKEHKAATRSTCHTSSEVHKYDPWPNGKSCNKKHVAHKLRCAKCWPMAKHKAATRNT